MTVSLYSAICFTAAVISYRSISSRRFIDYADLTASDAFDRVYSEVIYHLENYITRHEGKVVFYNHDKNFGSIFQDGEENLFFRQADFLDDEEVEKYDVVEYSVIKTYDRKRQQMSSKAVLLKVLYEEINY